jgi:hypothetical protein
VLDLVRVDVELLCKLDHRLLALDRSERDFRLEGTGPWLRRGRFVILASS